MESIKTLFSIAILSIALFSCERGGSGKCAETNISTATRASHNAGETCTKCHTQGKDGRGCFTIAGTVYKQDKSTPLTDAVMVLFNRDANDWTKITGEAKRLPIDKSGNFYTTESVDFVGKYPAILFKKNNKWDTLIMKTRLESTSSCNKCHTNKPVDINDNEIKQTDPIFDNLNN